MKPRVLRTTQAEIDLLEIWSYVAAASEQAADSLIHEIDAASNATAMNPLAGRLREELGSNIRSFSVGRYLVFYCPTENGIVILRILHGARNLPDLF